MTDEIIDQRCIVKGEKRMSWIFRGLAKCAEKSGQSISEISEHLGRLRDIDPTMDVEDHMRARYGVDVENMRQRELFEGVRQEIKSKSFSGAPETPQNNFYKHIENLQDKK